MYKVSVPIIIGNPYFEEYFPELLERCKKGGVARIYLCVSMSTCSEQHKQLELEKLKKYTAILTENGIEPGVWFSPLGHGGTLANGEVVSTDESADITLMRDIDGNLMGDSNCPLNEGYQKQSGEWVQRLAEAGARIILLDDDFRLRYRTGKPACCCEKHKALLEKEMGIPFDRDTVDKALHTGGPNPIRTAWLKVQGESLNTFAARLREALDQIDPTVRMTHCACLSTWDVEGIDSLTLAKTFAGASKPLLRLIGAPYWANIRAMDEMRLAPICEYERMQQNWAEGSGVELFCEGDVYSRPRWTCPSAYLEGFDTAMRAAGTSDGILKYMFDYSSSALYETGYYDRHIRNMPLYEKIQELFDSKKAVGVRVFEPMHTVAIAHDPVDWEARCIPGSLRFVTDQSLPVQYTAGDVPCIVFGDAAELATQQELANGAILDADAVRILNRRGIDVGVEIVGEYHPADEWYPAAKEHVDIFNGRWVSYSLKKGAEMLTLLRDHTGFATRLGMLSGDEHTAPGVVRYQNAAGQRFLIYPFRAFGGHEHGVDHGIFRGWLRAAQLREQLSWLNSTPLDAVADASPDLYTIVKKDEKGLSVGLWNFSVDSVFAPTVHLAQQWGSIRFDNTDGELQGKTVTLQDIAPFNWAFFELSK